MTILTAPSPLISGSRPRFKPYVARAGPKVCVTRRWREVGSGFETSVPEVGRSFDET